MKREELRVGEEYALLSPSQRATLTRGEYRYVPTAQRIRVLDVNPVWVPHKFSGLIKKSNEVEVKDFSGNKVKVPDFTRKTEEDWLDKPSRFVKALVLDAYDYLRIEAVPLANVAMTWAEYEQLDRKAEERRRRIEKERRELERQLERLRESLREEARRLQSFVPDELEVRVVGKQLAIVGSPEDLEALIKGR